MRLNVPPGTSTLDLQSSIPALPQSLTPLHALHAGALMFASGDAPASPFDVWLFPQARSTQTNATVEPLIGE